MKAAPADDDEPMDGPRDAGRSPFDALYRDNPDPWSTTTRWYEARRRALLLASLTKPRYATAYEAGCGNGNVSERLAERCDRLLASDASGEAVALARVRVAGLPQVRVVHAALPDGWPAEPFDLSVVSEVLYFLDEPAIAAVAHRANASAGAEGLVVACDWRAYIDGYGHRGDEAHRAFERALGMPRVFEYIDDDFVLSGWCRDPVSVANR